MGYLTTITIYNDGAENIGNHPREIADKLVKTCSGLYARMGVNTFGVGMHQNLVKIQVPKNADEKTLYVHMENGVVEFNANSYVTDETLEHNPEYYNRVLDYIEEELNRLKLKVGRPSIVIQEEPIEEKLPLAVVSTPLTEEQIVKKWLKDNSINMTISELKKVKKK